MKNKEKILLVVESPTKSKTIKRYIGKDCDVIATMGHIVDLPPYKLGIDFEKDFEIQLIPLKGKKPIIEELQNKAGKYDKIYLAPDPDREGEAIAWHIYNLIGENGSKIRRVLFNEITKRGIEQGLNSPVDIDLKKVEAQKARRILDRLVGYKVSPLLWKAFYKGLSAGRVQTVAMRLIIEREEEILAFVPVTYWNISADLKKNDIKFKVKFIKYEGKEIRLEDPELVKKLKSGLNKSDFVVDSVRQKETNLVPPAPFITSTLQQEANRLYRMAATRTMKIAQELYEGIELGDKGLIGLITYMRTDSTRLSPLAISEAEEFITKNYGKEYSQPRNFTKKKKGTQDAHEAIRPTNVEFTPEKVMKYLDRNQYRIYSLIWKKFLASQATPAIVQNLTVDFKACDSTFRVVEKKIKFDGFLRILPRSGVESDFTLPVLKEGEKLKPLKIYVEEKQTEPPPRYSEGSLVKDLEQRGIGRPSTYAQIIQTIIARGYVKRAKGVLNPTEIGSKTLSLLIKLFPDIFAYDFTSDMEQNLDKIEGGEQSYLTILNDFYKFFTSKLDGIKAEKQNLLHMIGLNQTATCEKCGAEMEFKWSKGTGKYFVCPKCENRQLPKDSENKLDRKCPICGDQLLIRRSKTGARFIACMSYPKCDYTESYKLPFDCPQKDCKGKLVERGTKKRRIFYGCSEYPKCKFASWDKPVEGVCPECGASPIFKKGSTIHCGICKWKTSIAKSKK